MIDEIDILQDCKSRHFGRDAGEESLWLLCVIAYHHELIIELREESFDFFLNRLYAQIGGLQFFWLSL